MAATVAIGNRLPTTEATASRSTTLPGSRARRRASTSPTTGGTPVTWARSRGDALRREQPRDLLGEKRIARGAVVHGLDQRCLRRLSAHLLDQLADLVCRQPGEPYQLGLPGQFGQQRAGGMIPGRHLHVPVRPDDQRGGVMQLAGEEHEQPERRHVGPVQIVQDDHQRPLRRPAPQVRRRQVIGTEADRGLIAQRPPPRSSVTPVSSASTASPAAVGVRAPAPAPPGSTARSQARHRPPSTCPTRPPLRASSRRPPPRTRARSCPCRPHPRAGRPRPRPRRAASTAERSASTASRLPTSMSAGTPPFWR